MEKILATSQPLPATSSSIIKKSTVPSRHRPTVQLEGEELLKATDAILEATSNLTERMEILGSQDELDLEAARNNLKLAPMVKNIDMMVEKTRKAKKELELMMQTSFDLKDQAKIQEEECRILELEQTKVTEDIMEMRKRVDVLGREKALLEAKLATLKLENDELEAFLSQVDGKNSDAASKSD